MRVVDISIAASKAYSRQFDFDNFGSIGIGCMNL